MLKKCIVLLLLFLSCAKQIAPSGGPEDKTPPAVRSTKPLIGTVNYPVKGSIVFSFNEWIVGKNAEKCISIFPPVRQGIKIRSSGKTIELKPAVEFEKSTTYHIELNNSLMDLHGNSIGTPYHFFFSTGATVDSGKVFGCIMTSEKKTSQPKVALFEEKAGQMPDSCYFIMPDYVVQTDSSGNYVFDHVRKGVYRVVAFSDANNDNRLQPSVEQAFAPIERIVSLDSVVGPISLHAVSCDTITNRILSLKPFSSSIIMGTWARPTTDTLSDFLFSQWRIQRLDTGSSSGLLRLGKYILLSSTSGFILKLKDTMSIASYQLFYSVAMPFPRGKSSFSRDSIRFNGVREKDTVRPAVLGFFPSAIDIIDLKPRIKLAWSKPVMPNTSTWTMGDTLGDTVKLAIAQGLSDSTVFQVQRSLKPGRVYNLRLPDTLFSDITGNSPRDTAFGRYSLKTISAEYICYSLSGGAACLPGNNERKWLFKPLAGASAGYVTGDRGGQFRFDSIPSCKGSIASFLDFNGDSKPTPGNLIPWRKPEPYTVYPDTIEARARWDIEGIEIRNCQDCRQQMSLDKAPATSDSKKR